jgi:hypothetical protein
MTVWEDDWMGPGDDWMVDDWMGDDWMAFKFNLNVHQKLGALETTARVTRIHATDGGRPGLRSGTQGKERSTAKQDGWSPGQH